ncbi:glycosyltransferase [Alloprevotella sp. OH1205_COT-284]|uniref:glycosyltransferase n=1 Tax=Alloprevotella sp. OH1205_COT-284 TaxID=2491043 RepID=UPI001315A2D2|nr:glycosyltransferase [Alloprevotella sp. OH1205_COT-284]
MTTQFPYLLTIITVVRNAASEIECTLQSIASLKSAHIQYIVLDGGSTDGTQEIIQRYAHIIDYWHSRSDLGIYHALNSAIHLAKGAFILTINAGDRLLAFPQEALQEALKKELDLVCFSVMTEDEQIAIPVWNGDLRLYNTLPHQGCCYHSRLFEQYRYDIRYHVYGDFDLNQRLFLAKTKAQVFPEIIAYHDLQGVSNDSKFASEMLNVVRRNLGLTGLLFSWLYFKKAGLKLRWHRLQNRLRLFFS